jgi:hypothetical protein
MPELTPRCVTASSSIKKVIITPSMQPVLAGPENSQLPWTVMFHIDQSTRSKVANRRAMIHTLAYIIGCFSYLIRESADLA